jgi:hypothetical protein
LFRYFPWTQKEFGYETGSIGKMMRASLPLYHLPLMTLMVMLMFSINPMIYVLDQLQEHVPSYWNNRYSLLTEYNLFTNEDFILPKSLHVCMIRFVAEASMTRGGEGLHEDNRKMVPIISESTREERKVGVPPLKKKS